MVATAVVTTAAESTAEEPTAEEPTTLGPSTPVWRPSTRRAARLLAEFRHEQPDPQRFYTALAADSVGQLETYAPVRDALVLDVGGGPGWFGDAFTAAGARYVGLDADVAELTRELRRRQARLERTVIGSGMDLPFADDGVDICYSSNVLEHVPDPWRMAEEMVRVTRPGGIVFLSYTVWYGPWGGHETSPWHLFLGGAGARRRFVARTGREPKNRFGETMFPVTVGAALHWAARQRLADVVDILPRYHPWWARPVLRVPGLRELATWNLVLVLRPR